MSQQEYLDQIQAEFDGVIKASFPLNFLRSGGYSGPAFQAAFASENKYFKETEYYYKGELEFFHLTNYRNLFSILNSRSIRMYNLHNANDPDEYKFSAGLLNPSKEEIENRKNYIYTMSFCPISELNNEHVWSKYGCDFEGIGLVFNLINDPEGWDNFHISEIKYDLSDSLQSYVKAINVLKEKYKGCSFSLELEKMMAFHKKQEWASEKEVRLLTHNPYKKIEERLKFAKRELKIEQGRNRLTEYIDLNLWVDNDSPYIKYGSKDKSLDRRQELSDDYFIKKPKMKLSAIYFGYKCGLSLEEYSNFKLEIQNSAKYNLGYEINMDNNLFNPLKK